MLRRNHRLFRRNFTRHVRSSFRARLYVPGIERLEDRSLLATLGLGDLVFTGYQASPPDKISFVLLKSIDSGTVLTITDNAWTGAALSTSEGNSVITFGGSFAAGTHFNYDATRGSGAKWAVGASTTNISDVTSGTFALNASGDNLFAYNGSTAPTTGTSSAWVSAFASSAFLTSGSSTASLTYLPVALASATTSFSLGLASGASNQNGAYTASSVTGTAAQIQNAVYTIGNWTTFTAAGSQAIPPTATFSVQTTGNNAPTGLTLSNATIQENAGSNAVVGSLSTTDPDVGNTFIYALVSGTGSTDNASFNLSGNILRAINTLDFETKSSYSIRIRTTDQGSLFFEQSFVIQVININETVNLRLNELKVNPPGSTTEGDKFQYVELLGSAGLSLNNTFLVMLNGNAGMTGVASYVINLSAHSLGSNGLLMIKSPTGGHGSASGTTVVTDLKFDQPGGALSKLSVTFYLVSATSPFVQGNDYDLNNDGVIDNLPIGFTIIDHVGWSDGDVGDLVYGGVALTQTQGTPDAATRIVGNSSIAVSAWFNGDLEDTGNLPAQLVYDPARGSTNLPVTPVVASLTPGDTNYVNPTSVTTDLRIVNYNLAAGSAPNMLRPGLDTILQAIGSEVVGGVSRPIDLLAMQEIYSQANTSAAVASLLNGIYGASIYAHGIVNGDTTGSGTLGVVFNTLTLQLLNESTVGFTSVNGQPRQTLRYHFQPVGGGSSTDFYVYVSHWKASDDQESRDRRQVEAQAIRSNADALGQNKNIIYVGDYNLYTSAEPAFQTMIGAGNGQAFDPINRLGSWSDNPSFIDVFTQTPAASASPGLIGGGLDDRFDFQLISGELTDGIGLDYRAGSYRAFGNNGSVSINSSINSPSSTALAGLTNRTTVLNLLTTVSDHIPVVADYRLTAAIVVNQPPVGTDKTVVTDQNVPYVFGVDDFGFTDPNNSPAHFLDSVVVSSLPTAGSLTLGGSPVIVNQAIAVASITAGDLVFTPEQDGSGAAYTSWTFQVRDNGGTANGGANLDPLPKTLTINVDPLVLPSVRINEALVNPSDADDAREFIELIRLSPSDNLENVWLIELETDSPTARGAVDFALPLSSASFGSNNLLLIGENYETSTPYDLPAATGRLNLNRPGSPRFENSASLLLVYNFTGTVGVDYDTNDDGLLDSQPWAAVIDAVALAAINEPAYIGGTRVLNASGIGVVDAVVRFSGDSSASSSAAWYGGEVLDTGNGALDLQFQAAPNRTTNFPSGGVLTPGRPNTLQASAEIVGQYVYHANSSFAEIGIAQAIDARALLAKEGSTPQLLGLNNLINSTRGINGLVFDINNLPGAVTAGDFVFQMSPTGAFGEIVNPVGSWEVAPEPSSVTVQGGTPSRVLVTWPNNTIANRWLRVTVKANANTGLAAPEVFYVGHLQGESTGPDGGKFTVLVADILAIRAALTQSAAASSIVDLDKSGVVLVADILAARSQLTQELTQITIPASGGGGGGAFAEDSQLISEPLQQEYQFDLSNQMLNATPAQVASVQRQLELPTGAPARRGVHAVNNTSSHRSVRDLALSTWNLPPRRSLKLLETSNSASRARLVDLLFDSVSEFASDIGYF